MSTTSSDSVGVLGTAAITERAPAAPTPSPFKLPDEPLVTISPDRSSVALNLSDLWTYRELLYFLIWRDLKVRYKQTALGVIWIVMQPLLTTLIFTIFLGVLSRVPSDGLSYPIFVFAGLLPWTFFSGAVTTSGNSLVGSAHLITKVYFPRVIIPLAAVGARLIDFGLSFIVLAGMMIYYHVSPTWNLLMLPPLVVLITLLALAVGMWTSASNVRYRDVGAILPVLLQLWMFASPVVYPLSIVPQRWRVLYAMNPLVGVISGFRSSLLGQGVDWSALAVSTGVMLVLLAYATFSFRRTEKHFADIV